MEYLHLDDPKVQKQSAEMNWQTINKLMNKETRNLNLDAIFFEAVCNEKSCPDEWDLECRRDYQNCRYYNILDASLSLRREAGKT